MNHGGAWGAVLVDDCEKRVLIQQGLPCEKGGLEAIPIAPVRRVSAFTHAACRYAQAEGCAQSRAITRSVPSRVTGRSQLLLYTALYEHSRLSSKMASITETGGRCPVGWPSMRVTGCRTTARLLLEPMVVPSVTGLK